MPFGFGETRVATLTLVASAAIAKAARVHQWQIAIRRSAYCASRAIPEGNLAEKLTGRIACVASGNPCQRTAEAIGGEDKNFCPTWMIIRAGLSTGAIMFFIIFGEAYAELDQFDHAWRCIGETMRAGKLPRKDGGKPISIHCRRNRTQVARAGCSESGSVFRACARGCA